MGDITQDDKTYNMVPDSGRHRCELRRKRRGKPRIGDRADCSCGREYIFTDGALGGWQPLAQPDEPLSARPRKSMLRS